jgi:hypothetical protein
MNSEEEMEMNETSNSPDLSKSTEAAGYVQICPYCKEEIPMHEVQQGGLHMYCFGVEMNVWFVSLPQDPKSGYYENDLQQIVNMLRDAEDAYLIERKKMLAGQYYNLPDFAGF